MNIVVEVERAKELGLVDLDHLSLLNMVDYSYSELKSGEFYKISHYLRKSLRNNGVLMFKRGRHWRALTSLVLTDYGRSLIMEVEKRWEQ